MVMTLTTPPTQTTMNDGYYDNIASQDLNIQSLLFKFRLIDPSSQWNSNNSTRANLWSALEDTVSTILLGILAVLQYAHECEQQNNSFHSTPWTASHMIYITHASALLSSIVRTLTDGLRQHAQELSQSFTNQNNKTRIHPLKASFRLLESSNNNSNSSNYNNITPMYFRDKVANTYTMAHKIHQETSSILEKVQQVENILSLQGQENSNNCGNDDDSHNNNFDFELHRQFARDSCKSTFGSFIGIFCVTINCHCRGKVCSL
ncbi:hypothetical protein BDC45DRAFT_279560 [Circinella umbellata]|nr:hypothetical protein BDC45DRAFT_279560 [Circinella umbellata]